jgi:hypothetical protein
MNTRVILKKSSVEDKVPLVGDLVYGELALNYADGRLYFKDTDNVIQSFRSFSGEGGSALTLALDRKLYTATAGQTTFSVSYFPSNVDVYINGAYIPSTEYTATSGTAVVLTTAAEEDDEVVLIGYSTSTEGAAGATITDDTTTNTTHYLLFDDVTEGSASSVGVSSTKLTFNPSTGVLFSTGNQSDSLGVGTAPSGTSGEVRATNQITAYYSDARLKNFHGTIPKALNKVMALNGYYFTENQTAKDLGYKNDRLQVGVSAQEVEAVLPEIVTNAPIQSDVDYKTVWYDKLTPLLIEAIKEQQSIIESQTTRIERLEKLIENKL